MQCMDIIYSKAFAIIVAMHGADAHAGLPGLHPETRTPQQIESIWVSGKSPDLAYREDASSDTPKITMVSTPSPLDFVLETSVWDSRGWILQERLLSRRCLYLSTEMQQNRSGAICGSKMELIPFTMKGCQQSIYICCRHSSTSICRGCYLYSLFS
jgi:hypothetical protein